MVVLASDHAAKSGEIAFCPVGAAVHDRIGFAVIDAVGLETGMKHVPVRGFIGVYPRAHVRVLVDVIDAIGFVADNECQGATAALTHGDNDAAFAGLMLGQAAVNAVLGTVRRTYVPAMILAVHFDIAREFKSLIFSGQRLAQLVA